MTNIEHLKLKLLSLVDEINSDPKLSNIKFNQQNVSKQNMSFSGCNGRIWFQPFHEQYDVSLSGASVEKELTSKLNELFNKNFDGYKQANSNKGTFTQPYWRTNNFDLIKAAAKIYAQTLK